MATRIEMPDAEKSAFWANFCRNTAWTTDNANCSVPHRERFSIVAGKPVNHKNRELVDVRQAFMRLVVRPTRVLVLMAVLVGVLLVPSSAGATGLPPIITAHMTEIEEWVYRNAGLVSPMSCTETCTHLWSAEHVPPLLPQQEMWNEIGEIETKYTNLWANIGEFRSELGAVELGTGHVMIGWEIGTRASEGAKWLLINAPTEPPVAPPSCSKWDARFNPEGQEIGSTFYEHASATENSWYLVKCANSEIVGQMTPAENPSNPGSNCGDNGYKVPGWEGQQWWWNLCYEGFNEGHEVFAKVTAEADHLKFNFSRPEDYTGQTLTGELTHNIQTAHPVDPGTAVLKTKIEAVLPSTPVVLNWLAWVFGGEHGPDPVLVTPREEYGGPTPPSAPNKPRCQIGEPVNCSTGNQVETQTDLTVGGRGLGLALTRTYNSQLAASQSTPGPFGYGWTSSYSAHVETSEEGQVATVFEDDGSSVRFMRDGELWVPVDPLVQAKLAGEGTGYVYKLPNQTALHFSSTGKLTSEVDRNGNTLTVNYTAEGRLESVSDPSGRKITLAYNAGGQVESATDPMGHIAKYTYEEGKLATVTEPGELAANWKFKYDGSHELTEETDGRSNTVKTEYDASHRVIKQTDALERKRTWSYVTSEAGTETTITEPTEAVTVEHFNPAGLLTSVTHASGTPLAATTTNEYDTRGNLIAVTDPNGHTTHYTYDNAGNRTSAVDPLGHVTAWVYDGTHDIISTTTPDGETTVIVRDSHGNAEIVARPAPGSATQKTTYKYDTHGDLESATDPLEHTTSYEYDTHGNRVNEKDPEGNKRTWEYNEDSQETATVSPRGNVSGGEPLKFTTKTERDARGRPIKITDPLAHTTKYTYDAAGNVETVTDGNTHKAKYTYDADNEQTKVEEPNATILETGYDKNGQITSQTDGLTHTTKYVRNALEEIAEVIDPRERKTTKEYDKAGNLTKIIDAASRTTTNTYDAANRLTEISYSDGHTHLVKYEYNGDNKLTHMTDGTGETIFTYDQLDRLTESKNGHGETISYECSLANQPTKITYPNTKGVFRAYDKDGRLETVKDWLEHTTKFTYDPDSEPIKTVFPGTSNEDKYTYNEADQQSEVKMLKGTETLASLAYTRDSDGQVKKITSKSLPGEEKPEFTYDANNRLTKGGPTVYEYNKADNATKIGTGSYTYNAASELETGPSVTYTYNTVGQRTKSAPTTGSATTYSYDQAGNLTSVEKGSLNDTYTYDGTGLRASQTISGVTTYMAWGANRGVPLLLSDGTSSYIYGPGNLPVEQISSGGTVLYLHHDQQGSTRLLTSATGTKEATFTYDSYGNQSGHTGTATTPLGFDGQYTSSDTGLIYLRARVYDPATAQFLTVDPLVAATRAPYAYAGDNPVNRGDASGRSSWNPFSESFWTEGNFISESSLNPIPYYEAEVESYENGCGYFASVGHGLEGAIIGALDASGAGEEIAGAEAGAEAGAGVTGWGTFLNDLMDATGHHYLFIGTSIVATGIGGGFLI